MSNSKKLISHTSIYMLGDILRRAVSLIMLPIYTRYLTTEDYGIVELLSMLIDFASIIFGARVAQAVFRYYCTSTTQQEKNSVITSALFLSALMSAFGVTVVIMLSENIAAIVFDDTSMATLIALFAITMLLEPFMQIPLTHIRAEQRPWLFLFFSLTKLILQLSLNIYFVVILKLHVEGVVYSAIISGGIMSIILVTYSLIKAGLNIHLDICRKLFNFSLPLKLASIGSFYLAFGDRYFLSIYSSLSEVGIYALGYKFGFIFLIISWDPFQKLWDSEKYHIYTKTNAKEIYQKVFLFVSTILILTGLSIATLSKDLLILMSAPEFWPAYKVAPIIILAYLIQAWTKYCSFGLLIKEKTIHLVHAEVVGVITITIAYLIMIPTMGILGAAWATVLGFLARLYWTDMKARQFYNMNLPWGSTLIILSLACTVYIAATWAPSSILLSVAMKTTLLLGFITALYISPIFKKEDKAAVISLLKRRNKT